MTLIVPEERPNGLRNKNVFILDDTTLDVNESTKLSNDFDASVLVALTPAQLEARDATTKLSSAASRALVAAASSLIDRRSTSKERRKRYRKTDDRCAAVTEGNKPQHVNQPVADDQNTCHCMH